MSEKLRLVPGMYSLQIRTAKTCCVRFKDTPFGMAWMTDINLLIDTPSDEKDMTTIRKMLDSLEAVLQSDNVVLPFMTEQEKEDTAKTSDAPPAAKGKKGGPRDVVFKRMDWQSTIRNVHQHSFRNGMSADVLLINRFLFANDYGFACQ